MNYIDNFKLSTKQIGLKINYKRDTLRIFLLFALMLAISLSDMLFVNIKCFLNSFIEDLKIKNMN